MFNWKAQKKPIIGLSPMADMTDTPFNLICKEYGAPFIFKEMVSSEAVVRKNEKTIRMAANEDGERPVIQQIFGSDPKKMAEAAAILYETCRPDAFDINMGCPVYKIVSNFDGSALMKDPERASEIVKAMKSAVPVPVSVKTRLGWSDDREILEFVKYIENAGADLITIHGRTKAQGYSGVANWKRVGEARERTALPLLVNGDITTIESAKKALEESKADGFLIGRGALGCPWFFKQLTAALEGSEIPNDPSLKERIDIVLKHAQLQVDHYGENGMIKLRKHLPFYFKGMPGWKEVRQQLVRVSTLAELKEILNSWK